MSSEGVRMVMMAIFLATAFACSTIVLASALRRARAQRKTQLERDVESLSTRVDRLGMAIDSIALEVERIGEAGRFTTRLLQEQRAELHRRVAPPPEGRVITPH